MLPLHRKRRNAMIFFNKKNKSEENEASVQPPVQVEQKSELSRTKRDIRILNATQLQHVKDAKRLAETKLQGVEERLNRLQAQQQWLRRYNETKMILEREKKRLFELNKKKAVLAKDASMLERYDLFEGIHGIYQKLSVLKEQIGRDKRGLSLLEREADENRQTMIEQEKRLQQAYELYKSANANYQDTFDRVYSASQLMGNNEALDAEITNQLDYINKVKEETEALSSLATEKERTTTSLQGELEKLRAKCQSMEIHENMIRHGEAILQQLNTMQDMDALRSELQQKRQQDIRRQNEENELLGKTYAQYQEVLSQAETAEAELSMHRDYIQGLNGLKLQERALMLKGRRQMLLSALSLWKRISTGYESIEEKSRRVTAMRLNIQHLEEGVRQLEAETGKAQRYCKEKEYTYLLGKGQDIIQLRADLHEGTACSVCGATHHPYHSDTILDQSKLIGDMKTDYEQLASEANAKLQQLMEMQKELATACGQLIAEEETLNTIRIRQNEDVQEWKLYAELDPSFAECSESTNLDARTALLRQFIEKVSRDAETAEKDLETFTFHQSSIASISEELQKLEQRKSEINVRLNELNTGCHVLSREVEQTGLRLENTNKLFTRIYENMQLAVTIKDWYSIWQNNPEQLYGQIQKLITDWNATEQAIEAKQVKLDEEQSKLENMRTQLQLLARFASEVGKRTEDLQTRKAENIKVYQQLIPENDAKSHYQKFLKTANAAQEQYQESRNQTDSIRHNADIMQGRHDYYITHINELENEMRQLNEKLDLWMHGFNLQHPPVQASELDEVFADGKDWSQIRSNLKQINTDMLLCQTKVEDLNSRIIALETEDGHCSTSSPDIQESIAENQQALTKQRSETMMQLARLCVQLEDHERALAAERNSAEPETNLA